MTKRFFYPVIGLLILLQTACSNSSYFQKAPDTNAWQQSSQALNQLQNWQLNGKMSIRAGAVLYTADLYWQQQAEQLALRFVAPFAQAATEFSGSDENGYRVVTDKGEVIEVASPETLTDYAFGVSIPFHELRSWVKGIPANDSPVWKAQFNEKNQLSAFEQSGWQVQLLKYKTVGNYQLPAKLFLTRLNDSLSDNQVDVRLFLRRWVL